MKKRQDPGLKSRELPLLRGLQASATSSGRTIPVSMLTTIPSALFSIPAVDCTTLSSSCANSVCSRGQSLRTRYEQEPNEDLQEGTDRAIEAPEVVMNVGFV